MKQRTRNCLLFIIFLVVLTFTSSFTFTMLSTRSDVEISDPVAEFSTTEEALYSLSITSSLESQAENVISSTFSQKKPTTWFSNITALLRHIEPNTTVVWTVTNIGFLDITLNMLISMERRGIPMTSVFVITLDEIMATYMVNKGILCFFPPDFQGENQVPDFQKFTNKLYLKLVRSRPSFAREIAALGYDQVVMDSDIVVLKNFLPYLALVEEKRPKVYFRAQRDFTMPCGGFFWLRADAGGIRLFDIFLQELSKNPKEKEQMVLNSLLKEHSEIVWEYIPENLFPIGRSYFTDTFVTSDEPYIAHANWVIGYEVKIFRMMEHDIWFVDQDIYDGGDPTEQFMSYSFLPTTYSSEAFYRHQYTNALALAALTNRTLILPYHYCLDMGSEGPSNFPFCAAFRMTVGGGDYTYFDTTIRALGGIRRFRGPEIINHEKFLENVGMYEVVEIPIPTDSTKCALSACEIQNFLAKFVKRRWIHFENLVNAVFWSAEENIMPTVPQNARQNIVDAVSSFTDTTTQKCVWYTSIE